MKMSKLLALALVLLISVGTLAGSTIAWFTDEVTSYGNKIESGTLKIELNYKDKTHTDWTPVEDNSDPIFNYDLWEPGYTQYIDFQIKNAGSLALKYALSIKTDLDVNEENNLAEVIDVYVLDEGADRAAIAAATPVGTIKDLVNGAKAMTSGELLAGESATPATGRLVLKMQESAGNEYQNKSIGNGFALELLATQYTYEEDSFDNQYDANATPVTAATAEDIQALLDKATSGDTIQLAPGVDYGTLYLGRPTKSNNTRMYCETHNYTTSNAADFKAHLAETGYHTTPKYTTTIENLTIIGAEGATVDGLLASSGHACGDVYDHVLDKDYDVGSAYYSTLNLKNVTFKNVAFTGKIDINTSDADSVYDGVTFDGCSFTTGGTESSNGAAIRYYNEANNGKVRNITVKNCTFESCYQGVYVHHVSGVSVTNSSFDTTGHNAVAVQNHNGAVNAKSVVISNNTFDNIGDRVIRFGDIGADTQITMEYNTATKSGDEDGEVVKATSIAEGVKTNCNYNNWGGKVVNTELQDVKKAVTLTPDNWNNTPIKSDSVYSLSGDFGSSNVSLVMAKGVENVVFDGSSASNIKELIITQNGQLIDNANDIKGDRIGKVTVKNFDVLSQINVFACKTEVEICNNTAEALMVYAGNCAVKVHDNTIDGNFESHSTYKNATDTWNTNKYGIALNIFDYNLWLDDNTVTDALSHAIGINGWEGTFDTGDANVIESFKRNKITVNTTSDTKRAAFKVWDDETYASNDGNTNAVNATAQAFIDAVLADNSNTFAITEGYDHTIFCFYSVNTNK